MKRTCILLFLFGLIMMLAACGSKTKATTMHLIKTEGNVNVADGDGEEVDLIKNLGLYSGYNVETENSSYGWINLDDVKLTKMDEESDIDIQKEGKELEIVVNSGNLFFNVTEPLEDDETMEIRRSTMVVGIRGTCGWVEVTDKRHMSIYLLDGKVRCVVHDKKGKRLASETIKAGQAAHMSCDGETGEITVSDVTEIPDFVMEEVQKITDNRDLADTLESIVRRQEEQQPIEEAVAGTPAVPPAETPEPAEEPEEAIDQEARKRNEAYLNILDSYGDGDILYAGLYDLNLDGIDDLLIYHPASVNGAYTAYATGYIWSPTEGIANAHPYDQCWFLGLGGTWACSVYQERSTGMIYIGYLLDQDGVMEFLESINDTAEMDSGFSYDPESNLSGMNTPEQAREKLKSDLSGRFELLADLSVPDYQSVDRIRAILTQD